MPATKDKKRNTWTAQFYYTDWTGKKTGKNAKEKMIKTVYNRTIKVNEIIEQSGDMSRGDLKSF